jgi:hypothetical protein
MSQETYKKGLSRDVGHQRGNYNSNLVRIYITEEAYHLLNTYVFFRHGRLKGKVSDTVSELIIKAISQEMPEIFELINRYRSKAPQSNNVQPQKVASTPKQENVEAPLAPKTVTRKESIYDRWLVRFAGVLDGIQNMSKMEKEAKELKFLFYPVTRNKAVVVDRYWINKAIALGNNPKLKIGLSQAEEIAKSVIEGDKRDEELSLAERIGLALFMLNKDGYVIYSSSGWTLAIPDIALDVPGEKKPAPQEAKPEPKKAEEKEPEAKPEPKKGEPRAEDICSEKKIPEPADIDFMNVSGAVEQITIRECAEKRGYRFYAVLPELGIVVNPKYEDSLLEKIRNGQVKYARADVDGAVENYVKNRAKPLNAEEKEKILMKALLQEAKIAYVNGQWKVAEKPKTSKAETRLEAKTGVKTGSMIDGMQGQGV